MAQIKFQTIAKLLCIVMALASYRPIDAADQERRERTSPRFNRDATQIVYREDVTPVGAAVPTEQQIWIVNRDGSEPRRLTDGAKDAEARFSPDGKMIAFTRDSDIWTISIDGSNLRNVTQTKLATESNPEFTAAGDLVFLRESSTRNDTGEEVKNELLDGQLFALFATRQQSLVLRQLEDDSEKVLLGDGYRITRLATHPEAAQLLYILCKPLDKTGKPAAPTYSPAKVVAQLRTDGSLPYTVIVADADKETIFEDFRVTPQRIAFAVSTPGVYGRNTVLYEQGKFTYPENAPIFSDISQNGTTLLGTGIVRVMPALSDIVLYDIDSKTRTQLFARAH